ncbi:MAG: hypothetical protein IJZ07_00535 [Clostridia bacterium]|nr:hypothetical protein [Clostridia bacterium]
MRELSVTKGDFDRSVRISVFNKEVKNAVQSNGNISDIHFIPVIKGYEITFNNNGVSEKLCINAKSRFYDGLIIKRYINGKFRKIYFTKDGFAETANKIFAN